LPAGPVRPGYSIEDAVYLSRRDDDLVMTATIRTFLILAPALALSACAVPPVSEPEAVEVRATPLNPTLSSINARVLSDAGRVDSVFVASLDPNATPNTLVRLQSTYVQELGEESLQVGDTVSSVGMWGTAVRYGGMQFGTLSKTRDDVIVSNRMATAGLAVLPTVADALFASAGAGTPLSRQRLSVDRSLPSSGQSWNLAVRDALGYSESVAAPMIARTRLVEEGCKDFSVGFGRVREDYALASDSYGPVFANTTVACGTPLGFTIEGHGEYLADEVTAFGFGVARRFGSLGTASLAFAQSSAVSTGTGWMSKIGFEHSNSWFNVMVRSRFQSREFRDIASMSLTDPIMQRDLASIGVKVAEDARLSVAYAAQTTWSRERINLISLQQSMDVGRGTMSMSAGHSLEDNFGSSLFISYKRPFGVVRHSRPVLDEIEEFRLQLPQPIGVDQ
jgi:hypothetical protein